MASLKKELKTLRQRTAHGSFFVPEGALRDLLNRDRVRQHLLECNIPAEILEEASDSAVTSAIHIFAILVRSKQTDHFVDCLENEIMDHHLPLDDSFSVFEPNEKLLRYQWEFLAPIFTQRSTVLKLKDESILPFLEDCKLDDVHGGYADAFHVTLDARHQNLGETEVIDGVGGAKTIHILERQRHYADAPTFRKFICFGRSYGY